LDSNDSEESESSSDDSDAELLNERVENKFLQVMEAIRSKDINKINSLARDPNANIFDDEDFEGNLPSTKVKDTKFTLKDQIRQHALKKMSDSESASSSDDEDDVRPARRVQDSDLFTKKGVTLADQ